MWGITKRVALANGYTGPMRDITQAQAKAIYLPLYWNAAHIDCLPDELRFHVFDAAVNSGVGQSVRWLQRAVGVVDDGLVGPKTLGALSAVSGTVVAARFTGHRLVFMTSLKTWPAFGRGWANRIANNLMVV
jgi:lysozyme family protein